MERSSGILLPVTSLPSPHGVGALGKDARDFIDFLAQAEQAWWQVLPVGPTSYGDSPYQSPSAFAGNPYLIDLDLLVEDGLLESGEIEECFWGDDPARVDYKALYDHRMNVLHKACERGWERDRAAVEAFEEDNSWIDDYALFMAVKRHFGMVSWIEWPEEDIRLHKADAIAHYRELLADDVRFYTYVQYLFFSQWEALRDYAREKQVGIIGDLPIYVALDSADVWADPQSFQLDDENVPTEVAGVPPDKFSADGQLWGNPLYNYEAMQEDGYSWWIRRMAGSAKLYDAVRIDHFRGFESYWAVPYEETTARVGRWVKGPGMKLLGVLKAHFPDLVVIAEDLGYLTPEVRQMVLDSGFPGMQVLEFAFDARDSSGEFPYTYKRNCTCYTGTHDNVPIMGWVSEADPGDVAWARRYFACPDDSELNWAFIRGGMESVADFFAAQMQDYLGLGSSSRTNTPGILGGNWQWRLLPGQLTPELANRIADLTRLYGRSAKHQWQK